MMGTDCAYAVEKLIQFAWLTGLSGVAFGIVLGFILFRWANRDYLP